MVRPKMPPPEDYEAQAEALHAALMSPEGAEARVFLSQQGAPEALWDHYRLGYIPPGPEDGLGSKGAIAVPMAKDAQGKLTGIYGWPMDEPLPALVRDWFIQEAARLIQAEAPVVSETTEKLAQWAGMLALETSMVRLPAFAPTHARGPVQLSLETSGYLYGQPFNLLQSAGPMTVKDALMLANISKRFVETGSPRHDLVRFTLGEGTRWANYKLKRGQRSVGGRQRSMVKDALRRMRGTSWQAAQRDEDGTLHTLGWGPVDQYWTREPKDTDGLATVKLNEIFARQIRRGEITYLWGDTLAALEKRDDVAAILWMFLESERRLSRPRSYHLFSAPEGEPERVRDTPAIADLLRLHWAERRTVAHRVKKAARVIAEVDPRYSARVGRAKEKTMWTLTVTRAKDPEPWKKQLGTPSNADRYSEKRNSVLPVTQIGTPSNADPPQTCADSGKADTMPSVLPSVLPSYDFLRKQLGNIFGPTWRQSEALVADVEKELAKVEKTLRSMMPQHFGVAAAEEQTEPLKILMDSTLKRVPAGKKNPLAYLETMRQNATTPAGLAGDEGVEEVRQWLRHATKGDWDAAARRIAAMMSAAE